MHMFPPLCRVIGLLSLVSTLLPLVRAGEPAIIAKARAYLGSEAALDGIKSVRFAGTVNSTDPTDPAKSTRATIEIIAQKPDQQRVVATSDKGIETTVVDGYEGWQRFQDPKNPKLQRLVVLKPDGLKRLRAQAWENLNYFRGIERAGGKMEDLGSATLDGIDCQKISFIHPPGITFIRYFDKATGRLVQTDTDDGGSTREEGERIVQGVKFPTTMKMTIKAANGQRQLVTITFDQVLVNEKYPQDMFRMPSPAAP